MKPEIDFRSKIVSVTEAKERISNWQRLGQTIVFTNGCFDILHPGHIDYLFRAATLGNYLVIGLNADASVQRLKGAHRPIQDEKSRAIILAALTCTDLIVLFAEDTPYNLIKALQPDILVKGGDYKVEEIVGYDIVIKNGGRVITLDFLEGYSTSAIERKIKDSS
jgi:rfaE bifunctional protein nucleotidyltransferase chain/domain